MFDKLLNDEKSAAQPVSTWLARLIVLFFFFLIGHGLNTGDFSPAVLFLLGSFLQYLFYNFSFRSHTGMSPTQLRTLMETYSGLGADIVFAVAKHTEALPILGDDTFKTILENENKDHVE